MKAGTGSRIYSKIPLGPSVESRRENRVKSDEVTCTFVSLAKAFKDLKLALYLLVAYCFLSDQKLFHIMTASSILDEANVRKENNFSIVKIIVSLPSGT